MTKEEVVDGEPDPATLVILSIVRAVRDDLSSVPGLGTFGKGLFLAVAVLTTTILHPELLKTELRSRSR